MHPHVSPDYQDFLSKVLKTYTLVFGPDLVQSIIADTQDLKIHTDGTVLRLSGAPLETVKTTLSSLHNLSDQTYQRIVTPLFAKEDAIAQAIQGEHSSTDKAENRSRQTRLN